MQVVASGTVSQAVVGFSCQRSASILGGFGKSSLFSITVCSQLNNFGVTSLTADVHIGSYLEFSAQS